MLTIVLSVLGAATMFTQMYLSLPSAAGTDQVMTRFELPSSANPNDQLLQATMENDIHLVSLLIQNNRGIDRASFHAALQYIVLTASSSSDLEMLDLLAAEIDPNLMEQSERFLQDVADSNLDAIRLFFTINTHMALAYHGAFKVGLKLAADLHLDQVIELLLEADHLMILPFFAILDFINHALSSSTLSGRCFALLWTRAMHLHDLLKTNASVMGSFELHIPSTQMFIVISSDRLLKIESLLPMATSLVESLIESHRFDQLFWIFNHTPLNPALNVLWIRATFLVALAIDRLLLASLLELVSSTNQELIVLVLKHLVNANAVRAVQTVFYIWTEIDASVLPSLWHLTMRCVSLGNVALVRVLLDHLQFDYQFYQRLLDYVVHQCIEQMQIDMAHVLIDDYLATSLTPQHLYGTTLTLYLLCKHHSIDFLAERLALDICPEHVNDSLPFLQIILALRRENLAEYDAIRIQLSTDATISEQEYAETMAKALNMALPNAIRLHQVRVIDHVLLHMDSSVQALLSSPRVNHLLSPQN